MGCNVFIARSPEVIGVGEVSRLEHDVVLSREVLCS